MKKLFVLFLVTAFLLAGCGNKMEPEVISTSPTKTTTPTAPTETATPGEDLSDESGRMTGPNFYSSVHTLGMLEKTYQFGEGGAFDLYNYILATMRSLAVLFKSVVNMAIVQAYRYVGKLIRDFGRLIAHLHTGELYMYIGWLFLGGIVIFGLIMIL